MTNDEALAEIREAAARASASMQKFAEASKAMHSYTIAISEPKKSKKPKKTNYAKWNGGKK